MSQEQPEPTKPRKSKWLVTVVITAVGLAMVAGFMAYQKKAVMDENAAFETAQAKAKSQKAMRQYEEGARTWRAYIDKSRSQDNKRLAYLELGALRETQQRPRDALAAYREAAKLGKLNAAAAWGIARTAEATGDKRTAAEYYKKTLELYTSRTQLAENDREYLKFKVRQLEGDK